MLTLWDYSDGQKGIKNESTIAGVSLLLYMLLILNFSAHKMAHGKNPLDHITNYT